MSPSVLILGARAPVALDHARRFAHQGWTVYAADSVSCRLTGDSHSVKDTIRIASPRFDPAGFVRDLNALVSRFSLDMILPTCEEVFYLACYRAHLPLHVQVVSDTFAKLAALHSKWDFLKLAAGCGADLPDSVIVRTVHEARLWGRGRPIVLKPEYSRFGVHVRLYPNGIPPDAPELPPLGRWVAQQYVVGTEFCSYSVAHRGRLTAHSVYRPSWRLFKSASFYFEPAQIDPIKKFVENLVNRLDFTGQISFDWIVSPKSSPTVIECNPRATSGCHLFRLNDPVPQALSGRAPIVLEPSRPNPKMIGPVMLVAGAANAMFTGKLPAWQADYRRAEDILAPSNDRAPILGGLRDLGAFASEALRARCSLRAASTRDIEWDGQSLPSL